MMLLRFLLYLLLKRLYNYGHALEMCGRFTYHYRAIYDNRNISDALEVRVTPTRAECFSDCFHHWYCNRLLYNELTNQCQLHSSEGAFLPAAPGFKYYTADCLIWKRSTLQVCPHLKSRFTGPPNPDGECYDGENWVDFMCIQNEWLNTFEKNFPLPAAITSRFVVDITGTWNSGSGLLCSLRQHDQAAETILLRIDNSETCGIGQISSGQWLSTIFIDPIPISHDVPFNMQATFNSSHYQISVDGTPVVTDVLLNQVSEADHLQMFDWGLIEHVLFTYP